MEKELALFIEYLEHASIETNRAEDRKTYGIYLAYIAIILSKVILKQPKEDIFKSIDTYERLYGNTWIIVDIKSHNKDSYEKFKKAINYPGYPACDGKCI